MILRSSILILMLVESGMLGMLSEGFAMPLIFVLVAVYLFFRPMEFDVPLSVKILIPTLLVGYFFFRFVSVPELVNRTEWVFPVNVTVSLAECFMIGQIFELLKKRAPKDGLLNFCMLAMAVIVCCCSREARGSDSSLLFVGSVIGVTLICTIFQYSTKTFVVAAQSGKQNYAYRSSLITLTIFSIGISSWYVSGALRNNIEDFQSWWVNNFQLTGMSLTDSAIAFNDKATLRNITDLKKSDPLNPTLHIYCDAPPGYLRGRAYDNFSNNQWYSFTKREVLDSVPAPVESEQTETFFKLANGELGEYKRLRIQNKTAMNFFFLPLNATYVSGQTKNVYTGTGIEVDDENIVHRGLIHNVSYSGYVNQTPPKASMPSTGKSRLTILPDRLEPAVKQLALSVTEDDQTDAERIRSIESYFYQNYDYSLNQKKFPEGRDQISFFILERPKAHCEFFATAAVIFLRANGIPSRYVTGFATIEKSDEEDYYIARNKDAHAWAEAFDREKQQWVIVETTPGSEIPKSIWDQLADVNDENANSEFAGDDATTRFRFSNFFQQFWVQVREFFGEIGRQLRGPINIAITSLILFGLFYRYWWKLKRNPFLRSRLGKLEKERLKVEKRLARYKLVRMPNESMSQFEKRISMECPEEVKSRIKSLMEWFRQYETARFGRDDSEAIPVAPSE